MLRTSQVLTGPSLFFSLALVFSAAVPLSFAQEVKYIEDFALAQNREAALAQLIPGTNSHFYYHALHAQNLQQFDRVESILTQWEKTKRRDTSRIVEIRHRQALLTYNKNPEKSLAYLRKTLALRFDHERDSAEKTSRIPTQLDPNLIDWKKL
ncbi:MAG: hypothetical protein QF752_06270, partial [Planctomycetota bacterium]|nr:hypothetical protein [Planctomycetota bacterium]